MAATRRRGGMELWRAFRIERRDMVALAGMGDTQRWTQVLAAELVRTGRNVVTVCRTADRKKCVVWRPMASDSSLRDMETLLAEHGHVAVVGGPAGSPAAGDLAARISQLPCVDNTIVEVAFSGLDRSRMTALEASILPAGTTHFVPVVGLGAAAGSSADIVLAEGALPVAARVVPMIDSVTCDGALMDGDRVSAARATAERWLAHARVHHVVLAFDPSGDAGMDDVFVEVRTRVAAVVLAAGASSRFGRLKQLLPWRGGTLLSQVVDTVLESRARPVVVVLGNEAGDCRRALGDRPVKVVVNGSWTDGQSTSIRAGLSALPEDVTATLFPLADAPLLQRTTIEALLEHYWSTFAPVVWPEYAQKRGNPVLFDRALFSELNQLTGDTGGRSVIQSHFDEAERVSVADEGILTDIDTPQDYSRFVQPTSGSSKP